MCKPFTFPGTTVHIRRNTDQILYKELPREKVDLVKRNMKGK
jgi:hypothetical protein